MSSVHDVSGVMDLH